MRSRAPGAWRMMMMLGRLVPSLHTVPIRFGDWPPVYVDARRPRAQAWIKGAPYGSCPHEPELQAIFRRIIRPGDLVVDVGAHEGLHTMLFSSLVGPSGHVHAFEPNPALTPCLRRTIAASPNITLHECALGASAGELPFYIPDGHDSMASLADWTPAVRRGVGPRRVLRVPTVRLDDIQLGGSRGARPPQLLKVDVEGAELLVFQGARRLLDQVNAPIVIFEQLGAAARALGYEATAAADFLKSLRAPGFELYQIRDDGGIRPLGEEVPGRFDILAVPAAHPNPL